MVRRLLVLNGLAIIGLILFHSAGWGFTAMLAWGDRYTQATGIAFQAMGSPSYHALRVVEQLVVVAIPAFLFVSGYFIAVAAGRTQPLRWSVATARVKSLLIPYFIWSVLLLVLRGLQGQFFGPFEYLKILATGSANPAYYYVILLAQFYLIAPLLVPWARRRPALLLTVATVVQLAVQIMQYPVFLGIHWPAIEPFVDVVPKWFFPARIFWFSFGIVAGFHLDALKSWAVRGKWIWLAVTVSSFFIGIFEWEIYVRMSGLRWLNHRETLIDDVYCLAFLLCFVAFDRMVIPFSKELAYLGTKSFGIYLVHSPALELGARAMYHLAPWLLAQQLVLQPFLILVGFAVPLALIFLVERSPVRRYYSYVLG